MTEEEKRYNQKELDKEEGEGGMCGFTTVYFVAIVIIMIVGIVCNKN